MIIDQLVTDTFTAHEYLAPDADAVAAAVRHRIRQPRATVARPVAVAASVAVVAATAGGAVLLGHRDGSPSGAGPIHSVRPAGVTRAVSSARASVRDDDPTIGPLTMPFDLGWLPDGQVHYYARRVNVGAANDAAPPAFDGEYLLWVTTPDDTLDIDVQQMPGTLDGVAFKSGGGESISVDGRPGIESANAGGPGGYEVYFRDASGGVTYVSAAASNGYTAPPSQLTAVGRRVAQGVSFPGTTQVVPTFGVGYVPDGLHVRAFDVEYSNGLPQNGASQAPHTSYDVGTDGTQDSTVDVSQTPDTGGHGTTPGRNVQGHATRYLDDGGYLRLDVVDAVGGDMVEVASSRLPLAELYRIADGLELPS